jgi:hypothetical protein
MLSFKNDMQKNISSESLNNGQAWGSYPCRMYSLSDFLRRWYIAFPFKITILYILCHCGVRMAGLWLLSGTQNLGGASFLYCMYHLISKKVWLGGSKNDLNIPNLWTYIHINIFMFVMKKNPWSRGKQTVHIIHILRYCLCRRMSTCMVTVAD